MSHGKSVDNLSHPGLEEERAHRSASRPRPIGCGPAHRCSGPSGRLDRGGRGRGSPLPSGHLGLRQSASALLADRGSRAPPPAASLCFPESKMAGSRQRGPQARVRPLFCALLLSLSHFVRGDGVGGHPGSAGAAGTPGAPPHRRFEYKYSFKGPHLVQSDGTVPFWAHAGSKPGPRAGGRVPPRLAPPSLRLLSAAHLVRGEGDPRQPLLQVGSGQPLLLGPSTCPPALPVCPPQSVPPFRPPPVFSLISSVLSVCSGRLLLFTLLSSHLHSLLGITFHPDATSPGKRRASHPRRCHPETAHQPLRLLSRLSALPRFCCF